MEQPCHGMLVSHTNSIDEDTSVWKDVQNMLLS